MRRHKPADGLTALVEWMFATPAAAPTPRTVVTPDDTFFTLATAFRAADRG